MTRWLLATHNAGKQRELQTLLAPRGITVVTLKDLGIAEAVAEPHLSFAENALAKARYGAARSGLPTLADDSGLCVTALNGAPGVHSAYYSGRHGDDGANNRRLLAALAAVPVGQRQAHYWACLVFVDQALTPTPQIFYGQWAGEIALAPAGDQGFGYDPLFYLPERQCTVAQLDAATKNRLSHRAKALQRLWEALPP